MCSGVSQAVVSTTSDWIILYTSKANWTYDIINTEISKKHLLVTEYTYCVPESHLKWTYDKYMRDIDWCS